MKKICSTCGFTKATHDRELLDHNFDAVRQGEFKLHEHSVNRGGYLLIDGTRYDGYSVSNYNRLGQGWNLFKFAGKQDAIKFAKKIAKMVGISKVLVKSRLGKLAVKI